MNVLEKVARAIDPQAFVADCNNRSDNYARRVALDKAAAAISAHESALAEEGMVIVKREEAIPPALAAARFDQATAGALRALSQEDVATPKTASHRGCSGAGEGG